MGQEAMAKKKAEMELLNTNDLKLDAIEESDDESDLDSDIDLDALTKKVN
eukprot:CAMPEP_0204821504 /NCGR_PEP_ID=MMETSP1018-20131115/21126_1 /ASSEMBLY_ACC=CAM_ASM_000518 /TAXON_ID=46462 /ORGANISM="Anophryoides haemophila, Strain AH6" /LENGTH=49 /DNA_ID=CAMNT_0051933527 /DNA_START=324 /DNA_END=473 /DNA_ORIENTATION=+